MVNKKYKLYSSILALCMTLALMATGVWAILQQSLGVSTTVSFTATSVKGTINGEVEGGYAGVETDYETTALGSDLTGAEIVQFGPKYVFANITGTNSSWNGKEAYYINGATTKKVGEVVSSATLASAAKSYTVSKKSYVSNFSPTSPSTTDWTIAGMTFKPNAEGQTSAITLTLTIENTGSNVIAVSFPDDLGQWSDAMSEATAPSDNLLVSYATSDNGSAYSEPQAFSTIGTKSIVSTGITSIKILITVQDDSSSIPGINLAFQVKLEKGAEVWGGETAVALSKGMGTESDPFLIENGDQLEYLSTLAGSDSNPYYYKLTNNIVLNNASFSFKEASGLVEVKNRDRTLYLGTALEPTGSVTFSTGTKSVAGTVYTLAGETYTAWTTVTADTGLIAIGTDLYIGTGTAGNESSSNTQFDETASVSGQFYSLDAGTYTPSFLNVWKPIGDQTYGPLQNKKVDGDGYEISGIYINTIAASQGLFGFTMTNSNIATIKNINLVNGFVKGGTNVGGIVGSAQGGLIIDNCSNSATIYGNVAGGINGMMTSGSTNTISNSCNFGTISGIGDTGGVVANAQGATLESCSNTANIYASGNYINVGGISGSNPVGPNTFADCYNYGNVSGLGSFANTCGIVGTIAGNVTNCYNYGNVSGSGSYSYTCGIVATNAGSTGNITNCYNYGNVSGSGSYSYTCGIIGTNAGNITNCHNYGDIDTLEAYYIAGIACVFTTSNLTISNCSNNGSVSANSTTYVAGIVGHLYEGTMVNCYNTGTINNDGGNIAGVASDVQGNTNQITYCYNTGNINNEGDSGYTGGVFGQVGGVLISNCYNTGNIQSGSESYTGGVGGFITVTSLLNCYNTGNIVSSAEDIQIAGVAGYSNSDIVTNCYNTGDVEGAGWVAGVIAECQKGALTGCYNTGDIRTAFNSDYLAGVISFLSTSISATNCYNTGIISGSANNIGGVFGQSNCQAMTNCYNTGSVTGTSTGFSIGGVVANLYSGGPSTNCYNIGAISGTVGTDGVIGGVFGHAGGTVSNCYNIGAVTGTADGTGGGIGGIMGRNTGTFKNGYNTGNVNATATYSGGIAGYNTNTLANTFNIGTVTGSGTVGGVAGYSKATSGVITYSYYLVGSANVAVGSDLGTSTDCSDFDDVDKLLNSAVKIGTTTYNANSTTLLTILNAWVTENQTTPAYKTFIVGANGYPVFA